MPKVSPEHLERRRQQILEAASRCFARKGFDSTSMQDIFRESGLSAGAVYRYFPSKTDLVFEIAGQRQGVVKARLREMLTWEELPAVPDLIRELLTVFESLFSDEEQLKLLPEAWSAALYDETIAVTVTAIFSEVRGIWTEYASRYRDEGRLPPGADPVAVGALLTCVVPGFVLQSLLLKDVDADLLARGLEGVIGFT